MSMIRSARMSDVPEIHRLITHHAELNRMLFRSHADLYEHLRDFFVCLAPAAGTDAVVGCAALELVWRDLAEIKSLAVDEACRGRGIGTHLVQATIEEGRPGPGPHFRPDPRATVLRAAGVHPCAPGNAPA